MNIKYYVLICMGEVAFSGTYKQCEKYVKQTYKKYPNHSKFILAEIVGSVDNGK